MTKLYQKIFTEVAKMSLSEALSIGTGYSNIEVSIHGDTNTGTRIYFSENARTFEAAMKLIEEMDAMAKLLKLTKVPEGSQYAKI